MKKFHYDWKNNLILWIFITIIAVLLINNNSYASSARIEVKVIVPPMQSLTIKEPVAVTLTYPWAGMESGQPLIYKNVGNINIQSNVDWLLNISSLELYRELEIYIRPAGKLNVNWQRIDGFTAFLSGQYGSEDISWDLKIVAAGDNYTPVNRGISGEREGFNRETRTVNLIFTLTQL